MAPRPQATERKRQRGNTGKEKLPALASVAKLPSAHGTPPPSTLGEAGTALWGRALEAGARWLAPTDTDALQLACELADRREVWKSILADDGPVLFTDKGYAYQHPIVGALHTLERDFLSTLAALGFTPSDRSRLGVAEVTAQSKLAAIRANS